MRTVGVSKAKAQFSRLVSDVEAGQTITITRRGVPVAELIPHPAPVDRDWSSDAVAASIAAWRRYRKDHSITLGDGATIMDLINEGRHE